MHETIDAFKLIEHKLVIWVKELIQLLPNIAGAALIIVAAWLLARLARKGAADLTGRATDSRTLRRLIGNSTYLLVMLIGIFAALSVLHLDKTVTSILAGAGILGLALGFAFQDIAANFISGVIMAAQRPIRSGELVETAGHIGVVERIDLRTTELHNLQGLQVIVPNKDIFQSVLINYTRNGTRRVDLALGVSYGDDLEKVERVTVDAVKRLDGILPDKEVELFFTEFGDSSIRLEFRFWIAATSNKHYNNMKSMAIKTVRAAYAKEGITIPFPIRTLDFGIKGGQKLDTMLGERKTTGG